MSSNLLLIHLSSEKKYTTFRVGEVTTIGRSETCEIQINAKGVSGSHAKIIQNQKAFVLNDLGSTNGTYVNNKKINTSHTLAHSEKIAIGSYKFLVWDTKNPLPFLFSMNDGILVAICEFPFTIGRANSNHFIFSDKNSSSQHAQFIKKQNKHFIVDLNSTNGTVVNKQRIKQNPIEHFDHIKVGGWEGLFLCESTNNYSVKFPHLPEQKIEGTLFIGKGEDNDIIIDHATISRKHCRIFYEYNSLWIEDLGSSNGTKVNGKKISKWPLTHGDDVLVGNLSLIHI